MKVLKILLSIIALLLLLIVGAAIILPQVINPNDYKEKITNLIKEQTSLETTFTGDLTLSVFPWLGISTQQVTLSQPATLQKELGNEDSNTTLVKVKAIDIKVELIPLLTGQIKLDTILLQHPEITLITTASGRSSVDFLSENSNNKSDAPNKAGATNHTKALAALAIAGINIHQGRLIIDDKKTKETTVISELSIKSTDILTSPSAPLMISGIFTNSTNTPIQFSLNSTINVNLERVGVDISDILLSINNQSIQTNTSIQNIDYQYPNVVKIEVLSMTGTTQDIPFSLNSDIINIDLENHSIELPKATAKILNIHLMSQLTVRHWDRTPLVSGYLQSSTFDANTLLNALGVTFTPKKSSALSRVEFISDFNGTPNGMSLQNMDITIDDSVLKGSATLTHFASPQYRFDLSLDTINIDDYLPNTSHEESNKQQNKKPSINPTEALLAPIALFDGIHANGIFRAQSITANNLQLEQIVVTVTSDNNTTIIQPSLTLYDGKLDSTVTLDRQNSTVLTLNSQLSNVNLEPLLTAADITDQLSGIGNITADITAMEKNGKPTSQGTIKLSVKNGALEGIDIKKILDDGQKTIDQLRGKTINENNSANDTEDTTRFAAMTATLLLKDNILSNDDLYMEAPASRISGKGTIDISQQIIDYVAPVTVVNTNSGQGGRSLEDLKGLTIPVAIKGPLSAPKITPDYSAAIKAITEKLLNAEKEKLQLKVDAEKARLKQRAKEKAAEKLGLDKEGENNIDSLKDKLKEKLLKKLF